MTEYLFGITSDRVLSENIRKSVTWFHLASHIRNCAVIFIDDIDGFTFVVRKKHKILLIGLISST